MKTMIILALALALIGCGKEEATHQTTMDPVGSCNQGDGSPEALRLFFFCLQHQKENP